MNDKMPERINIENMNTNLQKYEPISPEDAAHLRKMHNTKYKDNFDTERDLSASYTLDEIHRFEASIGNKLPPLFRAYLLYVSRETYYSYCRTHVSLNTKNILRPHNRERRKMPMSEWDDLVNQYEDKHVPESEVPDRMDGTIITVRTL